jgi:hypothetical protein
MKEGSKREEDGGREEQRRRLGRSQNFSRGGRGMHEARAKVDAEPEVS